MSVTREKTDYSFVEGGRIFIYRCYINILSELFPFDHPRSIVLSASASHGTRWSQRRIIFTQIRFLKRVCFSSPAAITVIRAAGEGLLAERGIPTALPRWGQSATTIDTAAHSNPRFQSTQLANRRSRLTSTGRPGRLQLAGGRICTGFPLRGEASWRHALSEGGCCRLTWAAAAY